jgi:hypothetical protein
VFSDPFPQNTKRWSSDLVADLERTGFILLGGKCSGQSPREEEPKLSKRDGQTMYDLQSSGLMFFKNFEVSIHKSYHGR